MASRTAGYGPQCTISNVGGKVAVTFPAWGFDWYLYSLIDVDSSHYIYNQTRTASSAITAKSGSESGGYTFVTALDFAGASWVNTDRCVPTLQAAANDYTTIPLALVSSSDLDTLIFWYSSTALDPMHRNVAGTTKCIHTYGGMSRNKVEIYVQNGNWIQPAGDQSANTTQIVHCNYTEHGTGNNICIGYQPSVGKSGAGYRATRIITTGHNGQSFRVDGNATANCCQVDNCLVFASQAQGTGIYFTSEQKEYNNTIVGCQVGVDNYGVASTHTNTACYFCGTCFANKTNGIFTTCASTDATGTAGLKNLTPTQFAFWQNNDNNFFVPSFRILTTSSLYHTGTAVGGITTDIDGTTRANPPSIGAHEGTAYAYSTVTIPAKPTVIIKSVASGTVTLTITGVVGTAYAYYRKGTSGVWSAKSESWKRTSDGDIAITGLDNGQPYSFMAQNEDGVPSRISESDYVYTTPTAGTKAASGALSLPMENLRTLLANSAHFQAWVGVADAESAKAHIYIAAIAGTSVEPARPYALITNDSPAVYESESVAGGASNAYQESGTLYLLFEEDVASADQASYQDSSFVFQNDIGDFISDMEAIAGSAAYLNVRSFTPYHGPARSAREDSKDYFQMVWKIDWGI